MSIIENNETTKALTATKEYKTWGKKENRLIKIKREIEAYMEGADSLIKYAVDEDHARVFIEGTKVFFQRDTFDTRNMPKWVCDSRDTCIAILSMADMLRYIKEPLAVHVASRGVRDLEVLATKDGSTASWQALVNITYEGFRSIDSAGQAGVDAGMGSSIVIGELARDLCQLACDSRDEESYFADVCWVL